MKLNFDSKRLKSICESNDISYLGIFGSYATGSQRKDSDVDLLVDFNSTKSLLEKGKILVEFQELFKRDVDLVSRKNIKPILKPYIYDQLVKLYGEE